jgi:hypothetical protein
MNQPASPRQPPLQFDLRTMLAVTAACGLVFSVLRWIGAPQQVSLLVVVLLVASVMAAIGLVVVIAGSVSQSREERPGPEDEEDRHDDPDRQG